MSKNKCVEYSVNEAGDSVHATFEIYLGSSDDVTQPESTRVDKRDYSKVTLLTLNQAFAKMGRLRRKYKT